MLPAHSMSTPNLGPPTLILEKGQTHRSMEHNSTQKETHINIANWLFKKRQRQFNEESLVFSANSAETIGHPYSKKCFNLYLVLYTKINSNWIGGLNIKPETLKLLEENRRENLYNLELDNVFLAMISKVQSTSKEKY